MEIDTFEAKNKLSTIRDLVEHGQEIVITRRGKPVARLASDTPQLGRNQSQACISLSPDSPATHAWVYPEEITQAVVEVLGIFLERRPCHRITYRRPIRRLRSSWALVQRRVPTAPYPLLTNTIAQ